MTHPAPRPPADPPETDSERQARLAWEAGAIAQARASAAAGRVIPADTVHAWIDSLDTDDERPAPIADR